MILQIWPKLSKFDKIASYKNYLHMVLSWDIMSRHGWFKDIVQVTFIYSHFVRIAFAFYLVILCIRGLISCKTLCSWSFVICNFFSLGISCMVFSRLRFILWQFFRRFICHFVQMKLICSLFRYSVSISYLGRYINIFFQMIS